MSGSEAFHHRLRLETAARAEAGLLAQVAAATAAALDVDGVAITLRTAPAHLQLMAATSPTAARLEDLQMTLGEGPTVDAYESFGPVFVEDLAAPERARWPVLEGALGTSDLGGLSALPLQIGAIRLGVLSLYRSVPGLLGRDSLIEALEVTDAVTIVLLMAGRNRHLDDSELAWLAGSEHSNQINQATGMVVAQLNVSADEAYVRLRSHAFATGRPLSDLAQDVVLRHVRLER